MAVNQHHNVRKKETKRRIWDDEKPVPCLSLVAIQLCQREEDYFSTSHLSLPFPYSHLPPSPSLLPSPLPHISLPPPFFSLYQVTHPKVISVPLGMSLGTAMQISDIGFDVLKRDTKYALHILLLMLLLLLVMLILLLILILLLLLHLLFLLLRLHLLLLLPLSLLLILIVILLLLMLLMLLLMFYCML